MTTGRVSLRLLGPLAVVDPAGEPVDVGSPRHREALAALAVDTGRVVSTDTLLARVWGEGVRGATLANLQAVISRLRSRLRDAGVPAEIETVPPGYRLVLPEGATDAEQLDAGLARARAALAAGDAATAHDELEAALAWWRGAPLADVPQQFARTEAMRLEGLRLTAEELAAEVDLGLDRTDRAIERLQSLASQHPLRESVRAQLMRALYLAGRQADALGEYGAVRDLLVEELGVDPGPALQRLHQQILEHDPALHPQPRAATAPPAPAALPAPAARPARPAGLGPAGGPPMVTLPSTDLLGDLVGRERDIDYLVELLRSPASRLVTVTGVGGCGKTRLALAVAAEAASYFPDGVAAVPLAPLTDPAAVVPAIAHAVGVAEGGDPFTALLDLLRDREQLLLLDNAEHLVDAWPEVATLAAACPGLRVLVTSRVPLRVRGEALYPINPLDLPASIALFEARARAVRPGFAPDDALVTLCQRLAGIPLAIELAAARARMLAPAAILSRFEEVMSSEGARDLPPRQRTMRAAIDWSFELLSPAERAAFPRLAVFSGGFGIEAAEAVLADVLPPGQVLGLVESLVDQSLVVADPGGEAGPRFRLLEPVAQYAQSRLSEDDERAARDAHLRHYLALAERVEPSFRGPGTVAALALVELEHANLVAAIEWSIASGQPEQGGWLGWNLWLFWWLRGALREGRRLMERVLGGDISDLVRVRAGSVVGAMAFAQGDLEGAAIWVESTELARRIGDDEGLPYALGGIGLVALATDDLERAAEVQLETIAVCECTGRTGEWIWTLSHVWLGTIELLRGDPGAASRLVEHALEAGRSRRDPLAVYIALFTAVQVSMALGEPDRARTQIAEGVRLSRDTGDLANLAYFLDALAVVEAVAGDPGKVGRLRGAAARLRAGVGANVYGYYRPDEALLAHADDVARAARGSEQYDADRAAGAALSVDAMITLATA